MPSQQSNGYHYKQPEVSSPPLTLFSFLRTTLKTFILVILLSIALSASVLYYTRMDADNYSRQYTYYSHIEIRAMRQGLLPAMPGIQDENGSLLLPTPPAPLHYRRIKNPKPTQEAEVNFKNAILDSIAAMFGGSSDTNELSAKTGTSRTKDDETETVYEKLACKFPLLDPWDVTLESYLKEHPKGFNCSKVQPFLTYTVDGQFVKVNETEFIAYSRTLPADKYLNCTYMNVDRGKNSDNWLVYDSYKEIKLGQKVPTNRDTVYTRCVVMPQDVKIYENVHSVVADNEVNSSRIIEDETEDQLSVLLFFIDSTSSSMFQRSLPETYKYMMKVMNFSTIRGYNKVGDNSLPNVAPILTGKRVFKGQEDMPDEFNEDLNNQFFDHWPLIWKDFADKGYVTGHNEDTPQWGMFNYFMWGFENKPVDHYYRPYWLSLRVSPIVNQSNLCYGNHPKTELQINIVKDLIKRYKGKRKFIYSFITEISHDKDIDLERADPLIKSFLQELFEEGYFDRTAILLMSDHGHRYSMIRGTLVGLLEERMPFFSIYFPRWFLQRHTLIRHNLRINHMRLSTPFDVHETLLDILNSNFEGRQRPLSNRGLSQLYVIPLNRTCHSAGIPQQYCTCTESKPVDITDKLVLEAGKFLVLKVNQLTSQLEDQCVRYQLQRVMHAEAFQPNQQVINAVTKYEDAQKITTRESQIKMYRVAVEVTPGAAQFEGVIVYNDASTLMNLHGGDAEISRLNAYGNQSLCAQDFVLRKFCYCKHLLTSRSTGSGSGSDTGSSTDEGTKQIEQVLTNWTATTIPPL